MKTGDVVASRYRILRSVGRGGMGDVWAAQHLVTGRRVALKVLKAESTSRAALVQRFFREARAASVVSHPNVVEVHDLFSFEGAPVMVLELLEGESLRARLTREGQLELPALCQTLVPVISAVGTAHARGIVHRDLKPENIFLARDARCDITPKVLDFGIAKLNFPDAVTEVALTDTGSTLGTPLYMAPEQVSGEPDIDHRADAWSLGVMAFEALAGRRPFQGDNRGQVFKRLITERAPSLAQLRPELPRRIVELVDGLLSPERSQRPDLLTVMIALAQHTDVRATAFGAPFSELVTGTQPEAMLAQLPQVDASTELSGAREPDRNATEPDSQTSEASGTLGATSSRAAPVEPRGPRRSVWLQVALFTVVLAAIVALRQRSTIHPPQAAPATSPLQAADDALPPAAPTTAELASTPQAVAEVPKPGTVQERRAPALSHRTASPSHRAIPQQRASAPPVVAAVPSAAKLPGGILDQPLAPF